MKTLVIDMMVPLMEKINRDPDCRHVEIRYSSAWEFKLACLVSEWLMHKFSDRGLKVSVLP